MMRRDEAARLALLVCFMAGCGAPSSDPSTTAACNWDLVCGATDNKVYSENSCTHEQAYYKTCSSGTTCSSGQCAAPTVNPHIGALLTFANMPWGYTTAKFPHGDYSYTPPVADSCVAVVDSGQPVTTVPEEAVTQVLLWGSSGQGQALPQMVDGAYPYYLLAMPDKWPAATAAGQTWRWQVTGAGSVPSFQVSFTAPEPITSVTPLPKGSGLMDFSRSSPPAITWNQGTIAGQVMEITVSGGDLAQVGKARTLTCYPSDTGTFQLPASELMQFYPSTVTIGLIRSISANIAAPLTGGGVVSAFSAFQDTDQNGNLVPMVFNIY